MTRNPRGALCDRARVWAALAPDGELSELERKLLDAHVERCVPCARFKLEVAAVAAELRVASLHPLPQPISVPAWRHRQAYARVRTIGAAAAVALMAIGVASRSPLPPDDTDGLVELPRVTNFANNAQREVDLIIRRAENDVARSSLRPAPRGTVTTRPI